MDIFKEEKRFEPSQTIYFPQKKQSRTKPLLLVCLLISCLLLLTGCGEGKKYDKAKAMAESGDYAGAFKAFKELDSYKDAKEQASNLVAKVTQLVREAMEEGRYQEALELLRTFPYQPRELQNATKYAENALKGTFIQNAVYNAGKLSCKIAIAEDLADAQVRIALYSEHGDLEGAAYLESKINTVETDEGKFCIENYKTQDGTYALSSVDLNAFGYSSSLGLRGEGASSLPSAYIYNFDIFEPYTTTSMQVMGMYKAIANDGREGYKPQFGLLGAKFISVDRTFAGGKVWIDILSGNEILFRKTLDIPSAETDGSK